MTPSIDFLTTEEAAAILGVSVRRVQQLLDGGSLTRVARGLVDATSVDRYQASAHAGRTRVWAEHTAWAAVSLLSGVAPDWMAPAQLSRLRTALRSIDAQGLVTRTRARAVEHIYQAHPAAISRLAQDLITTDPSALGLVLGMGRQDGAAGPRNVEGVPGLVSGYYPASQLDQAVTFFGLHETPSGNLVVRATNFGLAIVRDLALAKTPVLVALDSASALDPRERGLGLVALEGALEEYRR